jgi:hypothetical protein
MIFICENFRVLMCLTQYGPEEGEMNKQYFKGFGFLRQEADELVGED